MPTHQLGGSILTGNSLVPNAENEKLKVASTRAHMRNLCVIIAVNVRRPAMAGLLSFLLEKGLAANRYTLDRLLAIHHYFYEVVAVLHQAAVSSVQVPTDLVLASEYRSVEAVHALTQNVEYVDGSGRRSLSRESDSYGTVCRVRVYRQTRNGGLVYANRRAAAVTLVASVPAETQYRAVCRRNHDFAVDVA
jgi:hypothetical protein